MRVGVVILPEYRWWVAEPKWRAAEELGFSHAWTYDHLGWRTLVDGPWFSAVPTLTAAAMVTSKIRLGTLVASPVFRHPVSFAREILTLDDVSDGRLNVGVGSGGTGSYDSDAIGGQELTAAQRTQRFGEFVELLDLLLTRDKTTWKGEFFTADEARGHPGCVQRPRVPFVVAADGPKAMNVAARYGTGWITTGSRQLENPGYEDWWRGVAKVTRRFNEELASINRASGTIDRYLNLDSAPVYSLSSVEAFQDAAGRARELGFTDLIVHWPRSEGVYFGHETVLERVAGDVFPGLTDSEVRG
ncbi:LLM class flavin-dependent oxidoreductase [Lentzea sp. NPDC058436]|uniref:LLM class flavin-dependent oxidoreductase n=1 Tax=Lentzea sp. NPDC058436 TaxID=3346499 RepID=UPI00364A23CA